MNITVKNFVDKSSEKGAYYVVTDEKGKDHHIFGTKVHDLLSKKPLLQIGMTAKLDKVKSPTNEKYWDTVNIEPATVLQAVNEDKSGDFAIFNLRQKSIEKQCSLKSAVEHGAGNVTEVLQTAERFYLWLTEGIIPTKPTEAQPASPHAEEKVSTTPATTESTTFTWDTKTVEGFKKSLDDFRAMKNMTQEQWDAFKAAHKSIWGKATALKDFTVAQMAQLSMTLDQQFK